MFCVFYVGEREKKTMAKEKFKKLHDLWLGTFFLQKKFLFWFYNFLKKWQALFVLEGEERAFSMVLPVLVGKCHFP